MRFFIVALLCALTYAKKRQVVFGNCEALLTPELCTGTGDDGAPCRWHYGDNGCKEDTGSGFGYSATGTSTQTGVVEGTGTSVVGEGTGTSTQTGTGVGYLTSADGCEEFFETTCSSQTGENGESCHWVIAEGCKKADCEHFISQETCVGKTGEHGRACIFLFDEGCEETPGIDGSNYGSSLGYLEHDGCEAYAAASCAGNTGENGVVCHLYENECKESNCEHFLTAESCNIATAEDGETCSWNLGDGCKEATDPTEPHCDYYTAEQCTGAAGEAGKQCYWDATANGGLGECDEDNTTEIGEYELPGLLRSTRQQKKTSSFPSAYVYAGVFFGSFFVTAGITFFALRKCTQTPVEDIDLSYRAVV